MDELAALALAVDENFREFSKSDQDSEDIKVPSDIIEGYG